LIKDYASNYDTMDDATAKDLALRLINPEAETHNLRADYWPKFMSGVNASARLDTRPAKCMCNAALPREIRTPTWSRAQRPQRATRTSNSGESGGFIRQCGDHLRWR
jgi:hypothetical protein